MNTSRPAAAVAATCALLMLLAASPAGAQPVKMRPGLWEHTVTMKSQSGQMEAAMAEMQKSLAGMSPAQRKQMEQMMAQQGVGIGPSANVIKVCVTPEEADLDRLPAEPGCTQTVSRTGPSTVAMRFSCKGDAGNPPSSGEGTMTFSGPTAYTGRFTMKTTTDGKPEVIQATQSGKWLSAQCGAIKPAR